MYAYGSIPLLGAQAKTLAVARGSQKQRQGRAKKAESCTARAVAAVGGSFYYMPFFPSLESPPSLARSIRPPFQIYSFLPSFLPSFLHPRGGEKARREREREREPAVFTGSTGASAFPLEMSCVGGWRDDPCVRHTQLSEGVG